MRKTLLYIAIAFFSSCAQQVAPTGGPKDESPPDIQEVEPPSGSVNFQAEEIEIEFDEFVKLNRLKEQLVTSPPLKYDLITTIRGKSLKIEIIDTLKANATYVFNFGNSIVDIRENNPIENYTYVFSTGATIDSSTISGNVIKAFEGEVAEGVTVMAYLDEGSLTDSIPYKKRPDYIAISAKDGSFSLQYMQAAEYKLFALADGNDNYLFDLSTEKIAYLDSNVSSIDDPDSLELFLFEERNEVQYLLDQNEVGPATQLIFNLPVDSFSYSSDVLDSLEMEPMQEYISRDGDTVTLWWPERKMRFPLYIEADTLRDTLSLAIDTFDNSKRSPMRIKSFGPHQFYRAPRLAFSQPVDRIDTSRISLFGPDSTAKDFKFKQGSNERELILEYDRVEGAKYRILFDSSAFTDIYGYSSDSTGSVFILDEAEDYGSLKLRVKGDFESQLILQLLDPGKKLLREVILKDGEHHFKYLNSGSFTFKLILDENANGIWDTGDYLKGIQPEKVINYEGDIRVRARWDKEVEWIIN